MKNRKKPALLHQVVIVFCLCCTISLCFSSCKTDKGKADDIPTDAEFQAILNCIDILKDNIANTNSIDNIFGDDYVFEINGTCTYTALNAAYRIHIPYKISNTGGNDLIDVAYFINSVYIGSKIDYEYEIYKTWDDERQSLFYIARLEPYDKSYSKDIVNKAININH